jgi:hypothetical protein
MASILACWRFSLELLRCFSQAISRSGRREDSCTWECHCRTAAASELTDLERAGLDTVFLAEAHTFDSVSQLGYVYLASQREEAAASLPEELVRGVSLIGSASEVKDRVAAFAAKGIGTETSQPSSAPVRGVIPARLSTAALTPISRQAA